jgi:SAM-dependent methyltransferase
MTAKQQRWNERYQEKTLTDIAPVYVLQENAHLLPVGGLALDLASGLGANAIYLAGAGLNVKAIDYSAVAIEKLSSYAKQHQLQIETACLDLERDDLTLPAADVIVVSYYLYRPLLPKIMEALRPGGLFFCQTFCGEFDGKGPENPAFRLQSEELVQMCNALEVLYYQESCTAVGGNVTSPLFGEAMLVARKPE